ncbi:MAG: hypothetical protein U0V75_03005 [Ferruginibacter sp.]
MREFCYTIFLWAILAATANAQTKAPTGAAADKAIKAYSEGKLDDLTAALPALEKIHPTHPYTIFFKAYVADVKDDNVNEALKGYSEVIKSAPDVMEAYMYRSRIFDQKGMYQKAIEDMTNAIKYDTDKRWDLFMMRGEYYASANMNNEAFADFKQAISIAPSFAKNYRGLMNTGLPIGKKDETISILKKAIEGSESANAEVWEVWGDVNLRTKQFSIADKAYDKSQLLSTAHFTADSYNNASIAALNVTNFSKAKQLAEKAVALSPKNGHYYCTRSEISISDKTWEEVYTWAQKALQVNERSVRANKLMAIGVKFTNRGQALSDQYNKRSEQLQAEGVEE